jgi:hypothetical protein
MQLNDDEISLPLFIKCISSISDEQLNDLLTNIDDITPKAKEKKTTEKKKTPEKKRVSKKKPSSALTDVEN